MLPARCRRDTFLKSSLRKNIGAFRLAGCPVWSGVGAGSNPVSYQYVGFSLSVEHPSVQRGNRVLPPEAGRSQPKKENTTWCNGNIFISLSF